MGKFYDQLIDELALHIRQSAWLNTAPDPSSIHSKAKTKNTDAKSMTRLQVLHSNNQQPDMPAAGAAAHLLDYLCELGPVKGGGMGAVVIEWPDITAWQQVTGIELSAWEARGLRRLSQEYLNASHEAKSYDCPPPYSRGENAENRANVSDKIAQIFRNRKKH